MNKPSFEVECPRCDKPVSFPRDMICPHCQLPAHLLKRAYKKKLQAIAREVEKENAVEPYASRTKAVRIPRATHEKLQRIAEKYKDMEKNVPRSRRQMRHQKFFWAILEEAMQLWLDAHPEFR